MVLNLEFEIYKLKKQLNAKIITHYFQDTEVIDIADFIGSSREIIQYLLKDNQTQNIVLCTTYYVAELINKLLPNKNIIYLGSINATSANDSILQYSRKQNPYSGTVLAHINSPISLIETADKIFTLSTMKNILEQIPETQTIWITGSKNLANYYSKRFARNIKTLLPNQNLSFYRNADLLETSLIQLKVNHPAAITISHPEWPEFILEYADFIGSNNQLINYIKSYKGREFIVLAEVSIIYLMSLANMDNLYLDIPSVNTISSYNNYYYSSYTSLHMIYQAMLNPKQYMLQKLKSEANVEDKIAEVLTVGSNDKVEC